VLPEVVDDHSAYSADYRCIKLYVHVCVGECMHIQTVLLSNLLNKLSIPFSSVVFVHTVSY